MKCQIKSIHTCFFSLILRQNIWRIFLWFSHVHLVRRSCCCAKHVNMRSIWWWCFIAWRRLSVVYTCVSSNINGNPSWQSDLIGAGRSNNITANHTWSRVVLKLQLEAQCNWNSMLQLWWWCTCLCANIGNLDMPLVYHLCAQDLILNRLPQTILEGGFANLLIMIAFNDSNRLGRHFRQFSNRRWKFRHL